jgi:hypothetical protein
MCHSSSLFPHISVRPRTNGCAQILCSITQFTISELLCEAYGKSATVGNAIAGFAKTGIWPLNRHVFEDCDFVLPLDDAAEEIQDPVHETDITETNCVPNPKYQSNNSQLNTPERPTTEGSNGPKYWTVANVGLSPNLQFL